MLKFQKNEKHVFQKNAKIFKKLDVKKIGYGKKNMDVKKIWV